jgi:hypothetical protein
MGDLNFDMLNDKKCQALKDLCDVLDFSQLVLKPTFYEKLYPLFSRSQLKLSVSKFL